MRQSVMASKTQRAKVLWVHLGAPKTGSTSIQRFCRDRHAFLSEHDVRLIKIGRRGALNGLAIALNNNWQEMIQRFSQEIDETVAGATETNLVMSSEMLTRVRPEDFRAAIPALEHHPVRFVYYIKRQDKYLESVYKQKVKVGKTVADLDDYIDTFAVPEQSFRYMVDRWSEAFPEAEWHIRRIQDGTLYKGDVVDDFMHLFGIKEIPEDLRPQEPANVSPNIDTLELIRQLRLAGSKEVNLQLINRELSRSPQERAGPSGRLLTAAQARRVMAVFETDNEALRKRFFPKEKRLFDDGDIDKLKPVATSFNAEQLSVLNDVLRAFFATHAPVLRREMT